MKIGFFEVDVNRLNDELVKYQLTNFEFRDSIKVVDIKKYELANIEYLKKKKANPLLISTSVNQPKILPNDYIKIKYYMKTNNKTGYKAKINVDSLKKEQLIKNKNDI